MNIRLTFFALFFMLFLQQSPAQETPKTLLWRISGNGFAKPCYLYGTMHTKDKRAYYLGDSVYSSIQFCDGFAMEVDPAETVDSLLATSENEKLDIAYRKAIENDILAKGPDYYKKSRAAFDSTLAVMRKKFKDMSLRQVNRLERAYRRRMRNDMKTRLDLYLFDLAKTQGKVVGAVEDLVDQTSIIHEADIFDEEAFLEKQKGNHADFMEWMIETYAEAELDNLHTMNIASNSPKMLSIILYNRNDKMARRIDSLGRLRSTFCAVGAGHLPGDSGVIKLLRSRGFIVNPVFSSKKIEPGDIAIANKLVTLTEVSDADSNYLVQMPGRPTDYLHITNKLATRAYKELSNEILLMCGVFEDGKAHRTVDKVVEEIKDFFSVHRIKLYEAKKITRQQTDGYELTFRNPDGYIRMHIFCNGGKTYMFGAGSREKDSMYSVRCNNYLAGYKMLLNRSRTQTVFTKFISPDKAFSVGMPSVPKKENIKGETTTTREEVTLFTSVDTKSKTNYLVLIKEPYKGYFPNFDSAVFVQTFNEIKRGFQQKHAAEQENIMLDGYPAIKMRVTGESDNKRQYILAVMALRQNRLYCVTARGLAIPENEKLFDDYIGGFSFTPHLQTRIENHTNVYGLFSVKAVSPVKLFSNTIEAENNKKQEGESLITDYYAFDTATAATYSISSIYTGRYFWTENDDTFLSEYAGYFFDEQKANNNISNNDTLLYKTDVYNGTVKGKELLLKNIHDSSYTRLRIMRHGDSAVVINMRGNRVLLTDAVADSFFCSFRFINERAATSIFTSKTVLLVNDLLSKDSAECARAVRSLKEGFKFPKPDMELLLAALLKTYDNLRMKTDINELVAKAIETQADDRMVDFIKNNYPSLKSSKENIRMLMLNMLASYKTEASYSLLKSFLLNDLPSPVNYGVAIKHFQNALSLTASFFPELSAKITDRNMAHFVLDLASTLIDSNKLTYASIKGYEEDIVKIAKKMLEQYEENNYDGYYLPHGEAILRLLVKSEHKKAGDLIERFCNLENREMNLATILILAKNQQAVPVYLINKFCESPGRRIELYDELFKIKRQSYFTGRYAVQKSFAEAFAILYTDNQISPQIRKDYDIVAVKEDTVKGKVSRFYVFKVKCHYAYENVSYTCIIGPFDTQGINLSIQEGQERYVLYRVKYKEEDIETLFNDYLSKIR
jgi:uncharacterized protein YbaP (TraB family)